MKMRRGPWHWGARLSRRAEFARLVRRRRAAYWRIWLGRTAVWASAVAVGLVAVGFARLADFLSHSLAGVTRDYWWLPVLYMPAAGGFLVWLTRRFFPGAEGSGIPQAIADMGPAPDPRLPALLSVRIAIGKIFIGATAVGAGFSLGREGPTVQVGASLMQAIHRILPRGLMIRREHQIVAGGAAGISAAFNTPLAGVLFAIEEMSRGVEARMSGLVITAIVLAGVVAQVFFGGGHYFGHILVTGSPRDFLVAVLVSGLACGLAGGLFARLLIQASMGWTGRLAGFRTARPALFAAGCGLLIAVIGVVNHGATFASGYEPTRMLLDGSGELPWYFFGFKFASTVLSYLAGLPGGIFAPSLSIGAGIGNLLDPFFADPQARGLLLVLCMTGFLSAATQSPITSFIIVMEMVDGYGAVIALMAVALIGSAVSRLLSPPLYHTLATRYLGQRKTAAERLAAESLAPEGPAKDFAEAPVEGQAEDQAKDQAKDQAGGTGPEETRDSAPRT